MHETIEHAAKILKRGGVIIFPTDTVCGIGCDATNEAAVRKLFSLKRRNSMKATPILVDSVAMAKKYVANLPEEVEKKLMQKYWPGALTIVLPCKKEKIPSLVRGNGNTIGIRMPNDKTVLLLITALGVPLIGTSANISGEATPKNTKDIISALREKVDMILEGESFGGASSTVVDVSVHPWKVIRQGSIHLAG